MTLNRTMMAALAVGLVSAPALAQKPGEGGGGRVADRIARDIYDAADAIGTVNDALRGSIDDVRYRGAERFAIRRCAPRVERYGRMNVEHVSPYGRRSLRVYGTTDGGAYRSSAASRAFTCTVRDDGRVRLSTRRLG